jgi:hypothetical protein
MLTEERVYTMLESMKLTKHDYEMIADILDAHYEETVELQKDHYLDDETDYFKQLEYLEELIDKTVYMIGVCIAEEE